MDYINKINNHYIEVAKRPVIYPRFKVSILDHMENEIDEITREITTHNKGSISVNYNSGVRRTCSLTIADIDGRFVPSPSGYFWIGRKFKLYIGLYDNESDDTYWFAQGVYYVTDPTVDADERLLTLNGVDKFGVFGSETNYCQMTGTHVINAGTDVYSAFKDILLMDMGNGNVIDPIPPYIDPNLQDRTLPYDINKAPSTYFSDLLVEMANVEGADIYYDVNGRLCVISGTLDQGYTNSASTFDFDEKSAEFFDCGLTFGYTDVVNSVTIVGMNSDGDYVDTYTAKNTNPQSPTRIELIGEKTYYEESNTCYDADRVFDYANLVLKQKSILQLSISFSTPMKPHLDVDKVITLTNDYLGYKQERTIIRTLTIPLCASEKININACSVAELPYWELREGSVSK